MEWLVCTKSFLVSFIVWYKLGLQFYIACFRFCESPIIASIVKLVFQPWLFWEMKGPGFPISSTPAHASQMLVLAAHTTQGFPQPLSHWKLTNCQFFQQITILHSLFPKHLNSIMYAHSARRNYRKLIHSSIPRNRIIVLGLVVDMWSGLQGIWG